MLNVQSRQDVFNLSGNKQREHSHAVLSAGQASTDNNIYVYCLCIHGVLLHFKEK